MKAFLKKGLTFLIALAVIAQASILTPALTLTTYAETEETVEETVTNDYEDADADIDADVPEEAAPDMIQEDVADDASDEDEEDLVIEEAQSEETVEETITDDNDVAAIVPEVQVDIDDVEAVVEEPADEVIVEEESEDNPIRAGPAKSSTGTVLTFTSDVHNKSGNVSATRIGNWIDMVYQNYGYIDYMGFGGDMGNGSSSITASTYWSLTQAAMEVVDGKIQAGELGGACYVPGNHEYKAGDYGTGSSTEMYERYSLNKEVKNGSNYRIYCLGSAVFDDVYTENQITALQNYLNSVGNDKPIIK